MHDPNFPPDLKIKPSSESRSRIAREGTDASANVDVDADAEWDKDTGEDIVQFGIAGRIWCVRRKDTCAPYVETLYERSTSNQLRLSFFVASEYAQFSGLTPTNSLDRL